MTYFDDTTLVRMRKQRGRKEEGRERKKSLMEPLSSLVEGKKRERVFSSIQTLFFLSFFSFNFHWLLCSTTAAFNLFLQFHFSYLGTVCVRRKIPFGGLPCVYFLEEMGTRTEFFNHILMYEICTKSDKSNVLLAF